MNTVPNDPRALTVKLRTSKLRNRRLLIIAKPTESTAINYHEREESDIA